MARANPQTNVWVPGEGTEVAVPTRFILPPGPREGIVINLAEMRLYYYPDTPQGEAPRVETYPIGIGRMDWQTPLGRTTVTAKVETRLVSAAKHHQGARQARRDAASRRAARARQSPGRACHDP